MFKNIFRLKRTAIVQEPCPYCGGKPQITPVGDNKEFFIYKCSQCHKTPVKSGEARCTERGALKVWNKYAKEARK